MTLEQTKTLTTLPNEYKYLLVTFQDPLSCTSIEKHKIDTGESQPIIQELRQLPLHLKEKWKRK